MSIILGYDQIPLEEQSETFETFDQLIEFADQTLNGDYVQGMSKMDLDLELYKNGYYFLIQD